MLAVGIAMALLSPVEPPQERDRRPMAPTPERAPCAANARAASTHGPACGISELLMAPASVSQYRAIKAGRPGKARPPQRPAYAWYSGPRMICPGNAPVSS